MEQAKFSRSDERLFGALVNLLTEYSKEEQREILGYARGVGDREKMIAMLSPKSTEWQQAELVAT